MTEVLNRALSKYNTIIAMGDFNIDNWSVNCDVDKLDTFCDISNLSNNVHSEMCLWKTVNR